MPTVKFAVDAQKRLLGHLLGAAPVAAEPVGQAHQRPLPPANDPREGGGVAGQDFRNVGLVFAGAHTFSLSGRTPHVPRPFHFFTPMAGNPSSKKRNRDASCPVLPGAADVPRCKGAYASDTGLRFPGTHYGIVGTFTFVSIAVWAGARREERVAYYRSETIK